MSTWQAYFLYFFAIILGSVLLGPIGFILTIWWVHSAVTHVDPVDTHCVMQDADILHIPYSMLQEYRDYLKSAIWKALRMLAIKRDNYRCVRCGYIGNLQVHHTNYNGIYTLEFELSQLETVCRECHSDIHNGLLPMKKD